MKKLMLLVVVAVMAVGFPLVAQQSGGQGKGPPGGGGGGPAGGPGGGPGGQQSSAAKLGSDVPDLTSGVITTNIDADVPAWIKDNFHGIRAYMKDGNVVLQTRSLPPYTSPYWGSGHARYTTDGMPKDLNPNKIKELSVTLVVSSKPTLASPNLNSTAVECPMGIIGIAVDGLVIFNNVAAPPDYLANEVSTFDNHDAHPTDRGIYHYHTEPAELIPSSGYHNELIGIALDGFPIYGTQDDNGKYVIDGKGSMDKPNGNATLNNWVTHEQDPTPSGLPHYRAVANYYLKTTQERKGSKSGTVVPVFYLVGKYLGGKKGTITQ